MLTVAKGGSNGIYDVVSS